MIFTHKHLSVSCIIYKVMELTSTYNIVLKNNFWQDSHAATNINKLYINLVTHTRLFVSEQG